MSCEKAVVPEDRRRISPAAPVQRGMRRMRRTLTLLLLLVLAPLAFARQRAVRHPSPFQIPAVDAIAAEAIARGVPGIVIGVRKGNATYTKAWGDFDVEAHVPEHTSTIHQIASVSKQFTAAAIMRLVEQGKVKLDDRASLWVTELTRASMV